MLDRFSECLRSVFRGRIFFFLHHQLAACQSNANNILPIEYALVRGGLVISKMQWTVKFDIPSYRRVRNYEKSVSSRINIDKQLVKSEICDRESRFS